MEAQLRNPDSRPIPPDWTTHFDPQRKIWFYVNVHSTPPKVTFLHPDDEDPPSDDEIPPPGPVLQPIQLPVEQPPPQRQVAPVNPGYTPYGNVMQAQRGRKLSAAQQLYASAQTSLPSPVSDDGRNLSNISATSSPPRPQNEFDPTSLYGSPRSSPNTSNFPSPSIRSSSSSATSPVSAGSSGFTQRPRGARSPNFPGQPQPSESSGFSFSSLPPLREGASDFRSRALFNPAPSAPPPAPPTNVLNPPMSITTRHHRAASVPNGGPNQLPSGVFMAPKETPTYSTTARPLSIAVDKRTTPAFQTRLEYTSQHQQAPSLTHAHTYPLMTSNVAALPPGAAMPAQVGLLTPNPTPTATPQASGMPSVTTAAVPSQGYVQQLSPGMSVGASVPQMTIPMMSMAQPTSQQLSPTQLQPQTMTVAPLPQEARNAEADAATKQRNKVLKKVGLAVGKSALKMTAKIALGNIGMPSNVVDAGAGIVGAVASGISQIQADASNVVAAGAVASASTALHAVASSSSSPISISPTTTVNTASPPVMTASAMTPPQYGMTPQMQQPLMSSDQSYEEIVAQMNMLHMQQNQQFFGHQHPSMSSTSLNLPQLQTPQQQVPSAPLHHQNQQSPSPSDYATMVQQMQSMQLQNQKQQQQLIFARQQLAQQQLSMQHHAAHRPHSHAGGRPQGSNNLGSVLGGATHALVSSAIDYSLNGGTTDDGASPSAFADLGL